MAIELTEEQQIISDKAVDFLTNAGPGQFLTIGGFAGTGKAQPLYSKVYTPNGHCTMGDVLIGDNVCTPDGGIATVIGTYPQGNKKVYRFWFDDNTAVDSCEDHLWKVVDRTRLNKKKYPNGGSIIYSTSYIVSKLGKVQGDHRFYIPTGTCFFNTRPTPIDPYLLGVLLGDGSIGMNNFGITSSDPSIIASCGDLLSKWNCHLKLKSKADKCTHKILSNFGRTKAASSIPLRNTLRSLGLWDTTSKTKFIPELYMTNSFENRLNLLQGLMDTDGTVDKKTGMASYTSISITLATNVMELVQSIGGRATIIQKKKWCVYKGKKREVDAYEVNVGYNLTKNLFRLKAKKTKAKNRTKYKTQRCVQKAEYIGEIACQCIAIDHPDHLYITDGFVPTHNTTMMKNITEQLSEQNFRVPVVSYTGKAVNQLRLKGVKQACTVHRLIYRPIRDENNEVVFEKIPFLDCDAIAVDESSMIGEEQHKDLLSYDVPILYVGDHGQLEPIGVDDFNLMRDPDLRLETIHRQAADSHILQLAHHVRQGKMINYGRTDQVEILVKTNRVEDYICDQPEVVICGFNKTRQQINLAYRNMLGLDPSRPVPGDRIICLKNNYDIGIYNGMSLQLETIEDHYSDQEAYLISFTDEEGELYQNIKALKRQFGAQTNEKFNLFPKKRGMAFFDYRYGMTCHKCLAPNTLIETSEGLLPIQNISENGVVATASGAQKYHNKVSYDSSPMIKIDTKDGYTLTTTINHKLNKWTGLSYEPCLSSELKVGDFLRLSLVNTVNPDKTVILPPLPLGDVRSIIYPVPTSVGELEAEFFGLMVGDGTVFESGFRLLKRHEDVAERFGFLCRSLFKLEPHKVSGEGCTGYEVSSTLIAEWLRQIGGMSPNHKYVPECILRSSLTTQNAFLKGLFEDGTANIKNDKTDHIEWRSAYPNLVDTVRIMLLRSGIISGKVSNHRDIINIYGWNIGRFKNSIGFISSWKNARLDLPTTTETRYSVPVTKEESGDIYKNHKTIFSVYKRNNAVNRGYVSRYTAADIINHNPESQIAKILIERMNYHHVKITALTSTVGPSMCIEVPEGHQFFQNGFDGWNSQGSEYESGTIIHEVWEEKWDKARWGYTALSRFKKKLRMFY